MKIAPLYAFRCSYALNETGAQALVPAPTGPGELPSSPNKKHRNDRNQNRNTNPTRNQYQHTIPCSTWVQRRSGHIDPNVPHYGRVKSAKVSVHPRLAKDQAVRVTRGYVRAGKDRASTASLLLRSYRVRRTTRPRIVPDNS